MRPTGNGIWLRLKTIGLGLDGDLSEKLVLELMKVKLLFVTVWCINSYECLTEHGYRPRCILSVWEQ